MPDGNITETSSSDITRALLDEIEDRKELALELQAIIEKPLPTNSQEFERYRLERDNAMLKLILINQKQIETFTRLLAEVMKTQNLHGNGLNVLLASKVSEMKAAQQSTKSGG